MKTSSEPNHFEFAQSYFDDLAQRYPVMCASDEFHFIPRAENAARYYDKMENLDADAISESVDSVKKFQGRLPALRGEDDDLEKHLDLDLLNANINGFLIEFEQNRSWQYNPILYLKVAFIGLDHALHKPSSNTGEILTRTFARLSKMPRILKLATENIESVPRAYHQASLNMIADCRQYLKEACRPLALDQSKAISTELFKLTDAVRSGLDSLEEFLIQSTPVSDRFFGGETLERTLIEHFVCLRSLDEIFQIAEDSWNQNLKRLQELNSVIDPAKAWQQLYHDYYPPEINETDTIALYAQEIENLRTFFTQQGFDPKTLNSAVEVSETPVYLRSVRGAASFAAALSCEKCDISFRKLRWSFRT